MQWLNDFLVAKNRRQLTREESLGAIPIRNPEVEWTDVDGETGPEILLTVPPPKGGMVKYLRPILMLPNKPRQLQLDVMGSHVWRLCDGERSVEDVGEVLRQEYKLSYREAMLSLTSYLKTLGKRGLMAFAVRRLREPGDEEQDRLQRAAKTEEVTERPANRPLQEVSERDGPRDGRGTASGHPNEEVV